EVVHSKAAPDRWRSTADHLSVSLALRGVRNNHQTGRPITPSQTERVLSCSARLLRLISRFTKGCNAFAI
ncbi:MAG: hypothetical protein ABI216_11835, partial [Devosia sp.]